MNKKFKKAVALVMILSMVAYLITGIIAVFAK